MFIWTRRNISFKGGALSNLKPLNEGIGINIIKTVYEYKPNGIWYRELQRKTGLHSKTFDPWIKRLREFNILTPPPENKVLGKKVPIDLTNEARRDLKSVRISVYLKKVLINNTPKKLSRKEQIRLDAYLLISTIAAIGYERYELMPGKKIEQGSVNYDDFFKNKVMTTIDRYKRPGIGLNDLLTSRKKIFKLLDKRKNIGNNQQFGHIDLTKSETVQYLCDLKDGRNPIIKEISKYDYEFFLLLIDNDDLDNYFLFRKGIEYSNNQSKQTIIDNDDKEDESNLGLIYDIYYNKDYDTHVIKMIFDVNNEKTREFLELNSIYESNKEAFSRSVWGEPRYIIADPLLQEFIIECIRLLWVLEGIMQYSYKYKYKNLTSNYRRAYLKWYKRLFGGKRTPILENKRSNYDNIEKKWMKYDSDIRHYNTEMLSSSKKHYTAVLSNKRHYTKMLSSSKKYNIIHQRYSIISRRLFEVACPHFLDEHLKGKLC
jgi:transposase-like protein